MIKEDNNFLSQSSIDFIEQYVLSNNFPFYMQKEVITNSNDNIKNMTHIVLPRVEQRTENFINHPHHNFFVNILNDFCNKNNIQYNEIFRIAVNLTFCNGVSDTSPIHNDHNFEHNQLIVYLNNPIDKNCKTVLLDDNGNLVKEIYPKKFKGLFFNNMPHYMFFPKKGERCIIVFTFK